MAGNIRINRFIHIKQNQLSNVYRGNLINFIQIYINIVNILLNLVGLRVSKRS